MELRPDPRVFGDPFFSAIVRGVSQELLDAGVQLTLLMAQSYPDLDRIERYHREHDEGSDQPYVSPLFNERSLYRPEALT